MDLMWETAAGDIDALSFDATLREVFSASATPTEHAVETGASITDHVRQGPDRVSLECVVSNSPAVVPTSAMSGIGGAVQTIDLDLGKSRELSQPSRNAQAAKYRSAYQQASAKVLKFDEALGRMGRVLGILRDLKERVVLVTGLGLLVEIDNMVITSISAPQELADGDSCTFRLELAAIRFATSESVEVPDPAEPRGRRPTDAGAVAAEESTVPESLWHRVMGL